MLPLIEQTKEYWNYPCLRGTAVIGIQHVLGCTHKMLSALIDLGVQADQIFILGKCYSSSRVIAEEMSSERIYVSPLSFAFDSYLPYDVLLNDHIEQFLKAAINSINWRTCNRLVVLDDGGKLICKVSACKDLVPSHVLVTGVEQTSSGHHILVDEKISFPVVNIARSRTKLGLETPFIIENVLTSLNQIVNGNLNKFSTVLILGKGCLGQEFLKRLSEYSAVAYDIEHADEEILVELLSRADIIIGCSGRTSIRYSDYQYLKKGAVLASASSSDREFDAVHFRRLFQRTNTCHQSFINEDCCLVAGGFPVNFSGAPFSAKLQDIQLTLSLLLSGILQNVDGTLHSGLQDLDRDCQDVLSRSFKELQIRSNALAV